MEADKRKRTDEELDRKRRRVITEDNGGVAVPEPEPEDDEVEEFYAILRRIQVAVKYFQKGNGGEGSRREVTTKEWLSSSRWSAPSFEREDFEEEEAEPEVGGVEGAGMVEEDTGLDLNADPESEDSELQN